MDLTEYVDGLRRDLVAAAASGGPEVQSAADRLALALDPAVRIVLLEVLSHAAAEISQDLGGGSIDVRLKGREPQFVVTPPPPETRPFSDGEDVVEEDTEEGAVARITLRLPDALKQRAEDAAARAGQSLNGWLVNAVRTAVSRRAINVDVDLGGFPFGGGTARGHRGPGHNVSGWVR